MDFVNNTQQIGRITPFRFWCQKVLPAVYDDSLSYYELLCKVLAKLNEVIEVDNTQSDAISELQELVNSFISGEFDPYIEEKIDKWFQENEPKLMAILDSLQTDVGELERKMNDVYNKSFLHKNVITVGDSYGRGTGAGESGYANDKGWPYYIQSFLRCNFFLNVSNSAAGFVRGGHTDPYNGKNFGEAVQYAHDNQLAGTDPKDIDLIIIGGGVNDYAQTNRVETAYNTIRDIQALFPNAQIWYFPLASGDLILDDDHADCFNELCYGCSEGGAQVFNNSVYWLYPFEDRCSFGDGLHPNQQGYHFIGSFMAASLSGCYLTNELWRSSSQLIDTLTIADGATNVSFKCMVQNNAAWYGGEISRTGTGDLCILPKFCRPTRTTQGVCYAYANTQHAGPARYYVRGNGTIVFQEMIDPAQYDSSLTYTLYFMPQFCPMGHVWG